MRGQIIAGVGGLCAALLAPVCGGGCVAAREPGPWRMGPADAGDAPAFALAAQAVRQAFPPAYRATQRAIITVRGRQFVCDGLLTVSPAEGWHLALISPLGLITDLRVMADGSAKVLKVSPIFREEWAREDVAPELRWLFAPPPPLAPAGRRADGRLVLESERGADGLKARYACRADGGAWEELEVLDGARPRFHAAVSGARSFPGWPRAVPAEIEVDAGTHRLHVRVTGMSVASPPKEAP